MGLFNWTSQMSVGIVEFDRQHQGLFDVMNQLHEGMLAGHGTEALGGVLSDLSRYIEVHFGEEENLLREHGYPKLPEHRKMHEVFRTKVRGLEKQFKAGTAALSVPTLDFLRGWPYEHILGMDMQYKDFLAAKGVR